MTLRKTAQRLYQAGCDLIPLAPKGKKPLQSKWTTRPRTLKAELQAAIKRGCNIGMRLKPEDLIIDVDVKDGKPGLKSYETLTIDYPDLYGLSHCTHTPSGGFHVWLTKAPGKIRKSHGDYPGIDFLSQGAQVLIGGCVTEAGTYMDKGITIFPAAPEKLVAELNRAPVTSTKNTKPGAWDAKMLGIALGRLDIAMYRTDEDWLRMAMACHHATNGSGREPFLEWSASDPLYAMADTENGERWDSFSTKAGGVTGAHLVKQLREAGELDIAEQLTIALADVGAMFDVEVDPLAEHYAKAVQLINQWNEPHNIKELFKTLIMGNYDEPNMDQFSAMIAKRFRIRIGTVRQGFNLARGEALKEQDAGDEAIGEEIEFIYRMIESAGGRNAIVNSEGVLWAWRPDEGHYRRISGDEINGAILEYAGLRHETIQPGALPRLNTVLRGETVKGVTDRFWDTPEDDEGIINTRAGEVVLRDQEWVLEAHDMDHRLRNVTEFNFGPEGKPKHWMKWLDDAFTPDQRFVMSRRIAVGMVYTLLSSKPFLKKAWLLYGPPNTGKSMLIKVLGRVLGGKNYSSTSISRMTGNHGTAPLVGKMANFQSEIDVAERVDAATFKAVVSGDYTEANPKNQQQFLFQNRAVLWMAGNNLPKFAQDTTSGVLDRLVPVAFRNAVATEEIDRGLGRKLDKEVDRIINWALWIYSEELMFDFPCLELSGDSEVEAELKEEMATDESRFIEECVTLTKNLEDFAATEDLLDRYNEWTPGMPISKVGFAKQFKKQLRYIPGLREGTDYRAHQTTTRPQVRGFLGVRIKLPENDS